ncbi:homocysteine S-methyltransferase [Lentilactobacillus sp. SPB1-3]|uniref:Homocysteine S-methyltransferase n=1 Tax=Lentilactobacillus terminaliae TaxID=3003483 RepID=A0ACD5DFK8_9LACO|nr:homocysteine S-methyltransferase [Lentilactobacillus sp. SPB1-3]MCZ0976461.1 homocysteine S-methyltransferase [Lentilactobacillus sp. SPB1-3]
MVKSKLKKRLDESPRNALVLDGAMGTLLETEGLIDSQRLWSSQPLVNNPDAIYDAHLKYLEAGADVLITSTYQANPRVFTANGFNENQANMYIAESVKLAQRARDSYASENHSKPAIIAGSIAPYGAFLSDGSEYTGEYQLSKDEFQAFHRPLLKQLNKSGVDLLALETFPRFDEIKALVELIQNEFDDQKAWVALSTMDEATICDGTSIAEVVKYLDEQPNVEFIGANCTSIFRIDGIIKHIRRYTNKPIIVYPNNGDEYDGTIGEWITQDLSADFGKFAQTWLASGANIIGGCCRSTPEDISKVAEVIHGLKVE